MVSNEYQKLKGGDFTSFKFGGKITRDKFMTWIGYRREQSVDDLVDFMKGKTLMSDEDINDFSSHHHYPKDCSGFVSHQENSSLAFGIGLIECAYKGYYICELGKTNSQLILSV